MKLTKSIVDALTLPDQGQLFVWDQELRGFGIRLNPGGKTYIVQARVNNKTRRQSLGKHGVITVKEARERAVAALKAMNDGVDPSAEKSRDKAFAVTLREVVESYVKARDLKPLSVTDIRRHLDTSFSTWADRPIASITRDGVTKAYQEKAELSPAQANQAFRILRALYNYARAIFIIDDNPVLPENPVGILSSAKLWRTVRPKSRKVPSHKIGAFWNKLHEIRAEAAAGEATWTGCDFLAFVMLTGCRRNEAASLTWDRVHLDEGWWHIPDPKNENPVTLPLSTIAVDILRRRPRNTEYVFPCRTGPGHLNNARRILAKLATISEGQVSAHDLRRTFKAIAEECGIAFWKTKLLLNHAVSGDVTLEHYTDTNDLRRLAPEAEKIGLWIVRQAKIAAEPKVIDIAVKRAAR